MRPERALGVRSEAMLALAFIRRDQVVFRLPLCAVSFDQSAITGECFIELAAQAIAFLLECLATLAPIRRHRISSMLSLLCCDRGVDIGAADLRSRFGEYAVICRRRLRVLLRRRGDAAMARFTSAHAREILSEGRANITRQDRTSALMAVHALNAEHSVSARTKGARHPLVEICQPVQVELPLKVDEGRIELPVTDGTNAEATGAEPTPKVLPLPSLDERVEMHLRAVSGSDDATISRSRAAVRERILDAIADDIVPQILERKKWVEISEPIPSADPLVSRVIGICVVVFRNIFDLGNRLSEFLSSLTPRTLAWSATAAAVVILLQAAVITAVVVKEQGAPSAQQMDEASDIPPHAGRKGDRLQMEAVSRPGIAVQSEPPVAAAVQPVGRQPVAAEPPMPMPSDEIIAALVARGRQLIVAGDIPNARLVLQQAADAGNATAALELSETYDPSMQQLPLPGGRVGIGDAGIGEAGIAMAKAWYEKARDLGSAEAAVRLERLSGRDQR
jgi:hypothetical protein